MEPDLDSLVGLAQSGDKDALEDLVGCIQHDIHHLAMRMLVNPEDALDATQEILILVVTKLSTFAGKSAFKTWLHRVALNYLLGARKVQARDPGLTFQMFEEDLERGLVEPARAVQEDRVLLNELRVSCTMALLLCLDLKHRAAYLLGFILECSHDEAAEILGITKANFRKRLSRAREQVERFTTRACGIANESAACSCPRRLPAAMAHHRVAKGRILFSGGDTPAYEDVLDKTRKLEKDLKTLALQRATRHFDSPRDFGKLIHDIVTIQP
ncbi:RNA polymerase sigma factor [Sulfidibacter corallicola]|uniref:RNA polymerase sigma factor n=1 Tax=Sulfidibacter corallicola TaxID=2818388 RepID=A0A8A4TIS2_SULCO|nr:RNA polymerase sigma factor [Sulfidibacter corallicola]QTD49503.1 RNA polymerase sigma factor [Sulfidibacter corallicola]